MTKHAHSRRKTKLLSSPVLLGFALLLTSWRALCQRAEVQSLHHYHLSKVEFYPAGRDRRKIAIFAVTSAATIIATPFPSSSAACCGGRPREPASDTVDLCIRVQDDANEISTAVLPS